MEHVPDAPWIREAEMWGMPPYDDPPDVHCPVCGKLCDTIYKDKFGDEVGCENCIVTEDAYEWDEERRQKEKESEEDRYESI